MEPSKHLFLILFLFNGSLFSSVKDINLHIDRGTLRNLHDNEIRPFVNDVYVVSGCTPLQQAIRVALLGDIIRLVHLGALIHVPNAEDRYQPLQYARHFLAQGDSRYGAIVNFLEAEQQQRILFHQERHNRADIEREEERQHPLGQAQGQRQRIHGFSSRQRLQEGSSTLSWLVRPPNPPSGFQ